MVPGRKPVQGAAAREGVEFGASRGGRLLLLVLATAALLGLAAARASAATLPDSRAYELVSPPLKNGGQVMPDSQRTRAAGDGTAVDFASLTGFGDATSLGVATDYMSVRTGAPGTNGWTTHGISPPQSTMPFLADLQFMEPLYWGEFSDDLARGVFRSFSPVTDAPNVANEQNLYLRDDLRTPGPGHYTLLTDCPGCAAPFPPVPPRLLNEQSFLAGASQDFGHVIFDSDLPLTADSTADPTVPTLNLFEWDHGSVRLAGVLSDSACGSPPCAAPQSQAGRGAGSGFYTPHTVSADGSRIFFTVPSATCPSAFADCGDLYLRSDHATTVKLNASEKTNGTGPGGTDPNGPLPAQYWDASIDGSRAFFVSTEALTDDAPVDGDRKLYMYSTAADGQGRHLTFLSVDQEPRDGIAADDVPGVLGVSNDGHTVYFADNGGQLVAGGPTTTNGLPTKLFRWHDGALDYIGAVTSDDQQENFAASWVSTPRQARVSPDGRYLLFAAIKGNGLTGYNHGSCPGNGTTTQTCQELYLYRADATPHLVCVSCNPSRAPATTKAGDVVRTGSGGSTKTYHLNHALSDDGRRVFFSTAEALVPEDVNGMVDAYEYDVASGTVHLLSTGTDTSDSYFMDASRSGDDVFILTRQRLVGWDVDGAYDLYDVRVGGGVPDPAGPVICTPQTCRGPVVAPPARKVGPSATAVGSNVSSHGKKRVRHGCRRGFVRKRVHGKVRCVKRPRRHAQRRRAR